MSADCYEIEAKWFAALSHPVRLRIVDILGSSEECVCHVVAVLGLRQAYVSQQLAILKDAGLICERKTGQYVYYRLADGGAQSLLETMRRQFPFAGAAAAQRTAVPRNGEIDCHCPKCQAQGAAGGGAAVTAGGQQPASPLEEEGSCSHEPD